MNVTLQMLELNQIPLNVSILLLELYRIFNASIHYLLSIYYGASFSFRWNQKKIYPNKRHIVILERHANSPVHVSCDILFSIASIYSCCWCCLSVRPSVRLYVFFCLKHFALFCMSFDSCVHLFVSLYKVLMMLVCRTLFFCC